MPSEHICSDFQPVVENAVKHGLRPNKGPGEVVVQAKQNMDFLEITVMDNGVGSMILDYIGSDLYKDKVWSDYGRMRSKECQ